jgi:2-dehydropantoate 2-reductase
MTAGEIFADPALFRLEIAQLRETLAVMERLKIKVVDLPGTPVRLFAFAIRRLPLSISRLVLPRAIGGGRGGKMPSFHIDLYNQRGKSEVVYLNGAVADYGERNQVPTPANRFLSDTLMALTLGVLPIDAYAKDLQKLLTAFERFRKLDYSTTP